MGYLGLMAPFVNFTKLSPTTQSHMLIVSQLQQK